MTKQLRAALEAKVAEAKGKYIWEDEGATNDLRKMRQDLIEAETFFAARIKFLREAYHDAKEALEKFDEANHKENSNA